jgi:hypothetical protein
MSDLSPTWRECAPDDRLRDEAIQTIAAVRLWIASRSLSSGAHCADRVARNDGVE